MSGGIWPLDPPSRKRPVRMRASSMNLASIVRPSSAVVVGAAGGIGAALIEALAAGGEFTAVHALSRAGLDAPSGALPGRIDILDEESIRAAAARVAEDGPVGLVIVATGLLHAPGTEPGKPFEPEKTWRQLDAAQLARSFAVNAIGPALVAKHMLPLLARRGKSVFAALSARVGSIEDNRLGGWYGYRASKAALNQLVRTAAVELARTRPDAICMGLHPGTVATGLSGPFRSGVAAERLFTPDVSAAHLLEVIEGAGPGHSGGLWAWDGSRVPF